MKLYFTAIKCITFIENLFCYSALVVCSLLVVAQVANRYILNFEIMWLGDLSLYLFVPFLIYSIAIATRERQHTSVDVFLEIITKENSRFLVFWKIIVNVIVLMVIVYLIPMAYKTFLSASKYPEYGTLVQWFNASWIRQTLLISLSLCAFHTLHHIVMDAIIFVKGLRNEVAK